MLDPARVARSVEQHDGIVAALERGRPRRARAAAAPQPHRRAARPQARARALQRAICRPFTGVQPRAGVLSCMTTITAPIRNGVDTAQVYGTLDALKAEPELARMEFRVSNRWIDGPHSRSTIQGFWGAGAARTRRATSRSIVDASEPPLLFGHNEAPNPAEYLLHALAGVPDADDRQRRGGAQGRARPRSARRSRASSTPAARPASTTAYRNGFERIHVDVHDPRRRAAREAPGDRRAREGALGRLRHGHQRRARRRDGGRGLSHDDGADRPDASRRPTSSRSPSASPRTSASRAGGARPRRHVPAREHRRRCATPGYFVAPVPEELGGLGVSSVHDLVVASGRLARGDASVAIGVNMHLVACCTLVRRWRDGARRRQRRAARRRSRRRWRRSPATAS